jgi:hypothetical protein
MVFKFVFFFGLKNGLGDDDTILEPEYLSRVFVNKLEQLYSNLGQRIGINFT